jgi:hypothetical protein
MCEKSNSATAADWVGRVTAGKLAEYNPKVYNEVFDAGFERGVQQAAREAYEQGLADGRDKR